MPKRIALEISRKGEETPCGYVGKSNGKRWPVAKTLETADKWSNDVLAEGAANQYLGYAREKYPTTHNELILKQVECD